MSRIAVNISPNRLFKLVLCFAITPQQHAFLFRQLYPCYFPQENCRQKVCRIARLHHSVRFISPTVGRRWRRRFNNILFQNWATVAQRLPTFGPQCPSLTTRGHDMSINRFRSRPFAIRRQMTIGGNPLFVAVDFESSHCENYLPTSCHYNLTERHNEKAEK